MSIKMKLKGIKRETKMKISRVLLKTQARIQFTTPPPKEKEKINQNKSKTAISLYIYIKINSREQTRVQCKQLHDLDLRMRQSEQSLMSREQELQQLLEQLYIQEIYADNAIENAITNTPATTSTSTTTSTTSSSTNASSNTSTTTNNTNNSAASLVSQCRSPVNNLMAHQQQLQQQQMFSPKMSGKETPEPGFVELKIINQENYDQNQGHGQSQGQQHFQSSRRKQIPIYNANEFMDMHTPYQQQSQQNQPLMFQKNAAPPQSTSYSCGTTQLNQHQKSLSIGNLTVPPNGMMMPQNGQVKPPSEAKIPLPMHMSVLMSPVNTNSGVTHSNSSASHNGSSANMKQSPSLDLNSAKIGKMEFSSFLAETNSKHKKELVCRLKLDYHRNS